MSTPDIYSLLSEIFTSRLDRILEFEILPTGLGPLLQDGCSIGISKGALVQCFVRARQIFFNRTNPTDEESERALSVASQIILLFDCEHLTACNWRKRYLGNIIQSHDFRTASHADHEWLVLVLERELTLVTSFLNSPLHRHTKSPTLWGHRVWVMNQILRVQGLDPTDRIAVQARVEGQLRPNAPSLETIRQLFIAELDVVLRAGELHPKNYYAFSYMRGLHGLLAGFVDGDAFQCLARSVVSPALEWCLSHPKDISGWMFVFYLLEGVEDEQLRKRTVGSVVQFALDVGWEGECLWTFVDLAARSFGAVDSVQDMVRCGCDTPVSSAMSSMSLDGTQPEKQWMSWVARVRAYRAAGGL